MNDYHIGYIQGTFDMFHIGHLNLLQQAKKYCDILYVGVVSDEFSTQSKGLRPCIPFAERAAIVRAIGVVDDVFEVDYAENPVLEQWKQHKFDCLFSGDDHKDVEFIHALQSHNIDVKFFPYTEHISTTKIREKLRHRILYGWAEDYPFDKLPSCIALYGAGRFGRKLYDIIYNNTRIDIVCWVDKKAIHLQTEGILVELPQVLLQKKYDGVVIAVKRRWLYETIRSELLAMGVAQDKIIWYALYDR